VYKRAPRFAHDETYSLRALVVHRNINEHEDSRDWEKGLPTLVHLGDFTGRALVARLLKYPN